MDLDRKYDGIPAYLEGMVGWVAREYRINPLSYIEGGSDVIVEYCDGHVLGYDWIKWPPSYIRTVVLNRKNIAKNDFEVLDRVAQISLAKSEVLSIHLRSYSDIESRSSSKFKEVWNNHTSVNMPWEQLEALEVKSNRAVKRTTNTCDWCGCGGTTYNDEAYSLCFNCEEQMFG